MNNIVTGIAHTAYTTTQMDKMLDFYCGKLKFRHTFAIKDDNGNPWIEYIKIAENSFIELFYAKPEQIKKDDSRYNHLCFSVNDIHAIADCLKSNGIAILWDGPSQGKDKNWQCWCEDPDGNKIEFMQISPDSPQVQA